MHPEALTSVRFDHGFALETLVEGVNAWDGDLGREPAPAREAFSNIPAIPGVGIPADGPSAEMQITSALREKGLLVDVATTDGIEPSDPAPFTERNL